MRRGLALALLTLTASCRDQGVQRHQHALELYAGCVNRGLAPNDACFTEVLAILATVPASSAARARADALRDGLLTAQQPRIRTPLAIQGGPNLAADVVAQLQQCRVLAEQLGTTGEAERPAKMLELEACRAKAERLDIKHVHGESDGGEH